MTDSTVDDRDIVPDYPAVRSVDCLFDPTPEMLALPCTEPVRRVRIWDGSTPWLISGYQEVRALLRDPRVSSSAQHPGYPHTTPTKFVQNLGFVVMDPPEHTRFRRLVTKPFIPRRMETMQPAIQRIVDGLIDDMLAGPNPVDLVQAFALPVPSLVICRLLGVPYSEHEFFQQCTREMINPAGTSESSAAALNALNGYLDRLLAERRSAPGEDLITDLIKYVQDGTLQDEEATLLAMMLLIAGFESTANTIALGTLALLENPDQLAVLRTLTAAEEIEAAVEELLRYVNIARTGRRRVANADIEIGGHLIREGEGLILATELANRDEAVFENAGRLDLTRQDGKHLSFGHGVHQCLGQPLARMELQIVFPTLFRRIPTLRRVTELDELRFKEPLASIFGVHELHVTW